jgi:creatinine amidohydrolase
MIPRPATVLLAALLAAGASFAQDLPVKWEELNAADFVKAVDKAQGVCLLPFGVVEKHGPSGPLGTDLLNVRYAAVSAAQQEYAVVFPEYYFGQIFEAMHQPGTIAYSTHLQMELLEETTAEMGRNGCKKIAIVNGHGGNTNLMQYFSQTQIDKPKDYVVYALSGLGSGGAPPPPAAAASKPGVDGHAGEGEIATVMAHRPELVHTERGGSESGADLNRLDLPPGVTTGIWWYARFPNHYAGDASGATAARGEALMKMRIDSIANAIRAIKSDQVSSRLQQEFFERSTHPLDTPQ